MFINEAILKDIAQTKEHKSRTVNSSNIFPGVTSIPDVPSTTLKTSGIPVRVEIIGQAFSIASYIAMAGDEILIAEKAEMMIHHGIWERQTASEMRKSADQLEKMSKEFILPLCGKGC